MNPPIEHDPAIFKGDGSLRPNVWIPDPPPWRLYTPEARAKRGKDFQIQKNKKARDLVSAALILRRPLLVTGLPGTGKTTLAYAVQHELQLDEVLQWPITTRSTLQQGLYTYDALARLQDAALPRPAAAPGNPPATTGQAVQPDPADIGRFIRLGPLGTALATGKTEPTRPRVLLIDEIDKGDIDLPNDLLHVFEEGTFEITELSRLPDEKRFRKIPVLTHGGGPPVEVERGKVFCEVFPFVLMTSNGEREFPPAFLRRCLRLHLKQPTAEELADIVRVRLQPPPQLDEKVKALIRTFVQQRDDKQGGEQNLATDQLLNAVYLVMQGVDLLANEELRAAVWEALRGSV